jgi:hypothetical protein
MRSGPVAAEMVQHGFDVVWFDADVGHAGRDASPDIVNSPRLHIATEAAINAFLGDVPGREPVIGVVAE